MSGAHAMIGVRAEEVETAKAAAADTKDFEPFFPPEGIDPKPWSVGATGFLAIALAIAWIAGTIWLARAEISRLDPVGLVAFVATLCAMPALIGIAWLVAARSSVSDRLFAGAREMRLEVEALARTVAGLSMSIEANRGALAAQVRALTEIGDNATTRLAAIGRGLSEEIDQADAHTRSLGEAAAAAESRLAVLLASMPRAWGETEALGASLERVGLGAGEQIAELDARLVALAERGREAEVVTGGSARTLAAHIARIDATSETAGARLDAVTAAMSTQIDALLGRTAEAVEESRKGITAQGDAMLAMVGANQAALTAVALESAEALAGRIEVVDHVIDRVAHRLEAQREAGDAMAADLEGRIDQVEARLRTLHHDGTHRAEALAASIASLGAAADAMTQALREGGGAATQTIETTEALLIALDATARELDETLPGALARLDGRLDETRRLIDATNPELLALVTASEGARNAVTALAIRLADQRRDAEAVSATLNEGLATGREQAAGLDRTVDAAITRVDQFVGDAAPRLLEALLRVRDTADAAAERARETFAVVIPEAADALEAASAAAMRRAVEAGVTTQIVSVAEVAEAAVGVTTRAAERLEQQLARIGEATEIVDARLADARAERQGNDHGFARRASLLIERLNSISIDLTRSLAPEVSDAAWSAYLKGDRGVFTRRAVRLLNKPQQRGVVRVYNEDPAFREQVNQYIHDFESMLRTILAQRDGTALGVTLLSSDMGKLYVAMAQAIERLR